VKIEEKMEKQNKKEKKEEYNKKEDIFTCSTGQTTGRITSQRRENILNYFRQNYIYFKIDFNN
jgi:hypothetical protein